MSCSQCGHSNPPAARFCNACGSALGAASASVAQPLSYTPRHLAEKILTTRSALEGERKRVTVLFADLKGSTNLAEQVGDEEWHQILDRFFAILTNGVHRYEGTINQYTGDGIMALFGAPIAHEDHALRACHAALAMQGELREYADALRLSRGLSLSVRMGLNSGEVVVGKIGDDLRMDYTAQGNTVNLAARMEQIAEPGRIYLTRYTATQVEGYFRLRDLGAMQIKGRSEPLQVYELEGLGQLRTRLDRSRARGLSRFVGRERELAQLNDAMVEVRKGQGQVLAVSGNAGIGKSRLCFEFAERCRAQAIPVYQATGVPYAAAVPLYPVLGLMKSYFGLDEQDTLQEQRRKVAGTVMLVDPTSQDYLQLLFDFLGLAQSGDAPAPVPAELRQEKLFELVRRVMSAGHAPILILVEDLHWADPASEHFLAELCTVVPGNHILLLFNYRPDYVADWLAGKLDLELQLSALKPAELLTLAHDLLGNAEGMQSLVERLVTRAGGNPFFVEEAAQSLVEQGYLMGLPGNYRLVRAVEVLPIPDTVQGILSARIDRLSETEKCVLQCAAVVGQDFTAPLLREVTLHEGWQPGVVGEALGQLEELGFVNRNAGLGEEDYAFCHPLIQEVAYTGQLKDKREQKHGALAAALEAELKPGAPMDERCLLLAHHWDRAGQPFKAAQWQVQAAVWEGVNRESNGSLARYQRAIELLSSLPHTPELLKLAIVARAGVLRSSSIMQVPQAEAQRAYDEGVALAREAGDDLALAELLIAHGALALQQGKADLALSQAKQALTLARGLGNATLIARFRIPILLSYFASGRLREGLEALTEPGERPWYEGSITPDNFLSRGFRAFIVAYMGRPAEAQADLAQSLRIEAEQGRSVSFMHSFQVDIARITGHHEVALREARAAVERAERFGSIYFREIAYRGLAVAHMLHHQYAQARAILEQWLPHVRPGQAAHQFEAIHLAELAEALLGLGERLRALEVAREAVATAERAGTRLWGSQALLVLAIVLRANGDAPAAAAALEQLEALVEETGAISFTPFITLERAELAGRGAGLPLLQKALEQFAAIGADGWVERLRARLAERATA
ncbi:MAG: ATP-binding protein [Nevskiales bacterium]